MKNVYIPYKCSCMKEEAILVSREREVEEDILDFVDHVQKILGEDHTKRSPFCRATAVEYIKIPMDNEVIGKQSGGTA